MLVASSSSVGLAMAKNTVGNFVAYLTPGRDLVALATVEVELDVVPEGKTVIIEWQGKPVFIRHRGEQEIDEARNVDMNELRHKQTDQMRHKDPRYVILIGICTHLGCIPLGNKGLFEGWFCPCHASHYDNSGRIRMGPAPENLPTPPYRFLQKGNSVILGEDEE